MERSEQGTARGRKPTDPVLKWMLLLGFVGIVFVFLGVAFTRQPPPWLAAALMVTGVTVLAGAVVGMAGWGFQELLKKLLVPPEGGVKWELLLLPGGGGRDIPVWRAAAYSRMLRGAQGHPLAGGSLFHRERHYHDLHKATGARQ